MATDRDTLGRPEVEIFRRFAAASPLGVVPASIEKRPPPEPDILCDTGIQGRIAFELVEIIDEDLAKQHTDKLNLWRQLQAAYEGLAEPARSQVGARLGNALVHIVFARDASIAARRRAIPRVLQSLETVDRGFEGEYAPGLDSVQSIRVFRGRFNGPCFDVDAGGAFCNPIIDRLRQKFGKTYKTGVPIELLAHHELHHMPPEGLWLPAVQDFVQSRLAGSQFRRVWIYDAHESAIRYVCP